MLFERVTIKEKSRFLKNEFFRKFSPSSLFIIWMRSRPTSSWYLTGTYLRMSSRSLEVFSFLNFKLDSIVVQSSCTSVESIILPSNSSLTISYCLFFSIWLLSRAYSALVITAVKKLIEFV